MVQWCMTAWTEQSWTARRVSCLLNLYDSRTRSGAQPGFGVRPRYRAILVITPVTRLARGSRPNRARSAETARSAPETVPNRLRERAQPESRPLGLAHVSDPRAIVRARAARTRRPRAARTRRPRARPRRNSEGRVPRAARGRGRATSAAVAGGVR